MILLKHFYKTKLCITPTYIKFFAGVYRITKTEVNQLNRHDAPCDEGRDQMNLELCIKRGIEQKLNCTIPDMSSGEALPTVGKPNYDNCFNEDQFTKFGDLYSMNGYTEHKLYEEFGCIATCQGKYFLK